MTKIKPKIHNGTLFDYTAGSYCGVLVKENIMKKLMKLQSKHLQDVKNILADGADRGEVFPSMWTLHYPNGKQTNVHFIDASEDVQKRINNAIVSHPPRPRQLVFAAKNMNEAKEMADAYFEETDIQN